MSIMRRQPWRRRSGKWQPTMTRNDYVTQQTAFAAAQVNVRTQKLALLKAQLEYRWSVDGLASVS